MTTKNIFQEIQKIKLKISRNKIEEAITSFEVLSDSFGEKSIVNELVLLSADFHQYNTEVRQGRVSVFNETRNRIINSCLELLNQFEKDIIEKSSKEQVIKEEYQKQPSSNQREDPSKLSLSDDQLEAILANNSFNGWHTLIFISLAYENKTVISYSLIADTIDSSEDYVRAYLIPYHSLNLYRWKEVKSQGNWMILIDYVDPRICETIEERYLELARSEIKNKGDFMDFLLEDLERIKKYFTEN